MGLLTELIRQEFEGKRQEKELQMQGFAALLKQPDLKPDARDRILAQMGKSAGSGKPVVDLLGAVLKKHGKQQAAPQESEPGPGVPSESGVTREPSTGADGLPETRTRIRGTSAGEAPSRGAFYSPGEMAYMDKQATEQKQQQEIQQKVQLQTALATAKRTSDRANEGEEMQSKITRVKELDARTDIDDSTRESLKQQIIGAKPETGAWKEDALILANGTALPVLVKGGKVHTLDGKEIDPPAGTMLASVQKLLDAHKKAGEPKTPPKDTGELGTRESALKSLHPDWPEEKIKAEAATATLKHLDTTEKGAETRNEAADQRLKTLRGANVNGPDAVAAKVEKYTPGGPSINNPKGNEIIEGMAWQWLTEGRVTFVGLMSKAGEVNYRTMAVGRAMEILKDAGLDARDLPAIWSNVKSRNSGMIKEATFEQAVDQFEGTLSKNADLAEKLSAGYPRFDSRLANRVLNAWKQDVKGDPEANNLAAQLHGVANEWGKIMAGSLGVAGVPVSEASADNLIFKALSNNALASLLENVVKKDAENRMSAIRASKQHLLSDLRTAVSKEGVTLGGAPHEEGVQGGATVGPQKGARQYSTEHKAWYVFDGQNWNLEEKK